MEYVSKKTITYLTPILVVVLSFKMIEATQELYYFLTPPLLVYFCIAGIRIFISDKKFNNTILLFLPFAIWALMTSLWSQYPLVTFLKAIYHLAIMFSGVFVGFYWTKNKKPFLGFFLPMNILLIALSIYSLITNQPYDSWTGGNGMGFKGFWERQLTFGLTVLITFPSWFGLVYKNKENFRLNKWSLTRFMFPIILILTNGFFIILSYARTSILSLGVFVFLSTTILFNKTLKYFILSALLFSIFLLFNPKIKSITEEIIYKGYDYNFRVRNMLFQPSLIAAKTGSYSGIGYGTSLRTNYKDEIGGELNTLPKIINPKLKKMYYRDKGFSTLTLIEETGFVGLVLFYIPLFSIIFIKVNYLRKNSFEKKVFNRKIFEIVLLLTLIISLIMHAQFLHWWSGVRSFFMFCFYIILGSGFSLIESTNDKHEF